MNKNVPPHTFFFKYDILYITNINIIIRIESYEK